MRRVLFIIVASALTACAAVHDTADPISDAPEFQRRSTTSFKDAASYAEALQTWRTPEDVNAWIGARFEYDRSRAILLSETQRNRSAQVPIYTPHEFFVSPSGVCVDLSRFAVETLRAMDPGMKPNYLMIEFAPVTIAGNTLRMHWLASFQRDGQYYFFADSKRPGRISGPYPSPREFIDEYSTYRSKEIVAFRELESYQRKPRAQSTKQLHAPRP